MPKNNPIKQDDPIEYIDIVAVSDFPIDERLFVEIGQRHIILVNISGIFYAIDDECSHDGGPLGEGELDDCAIICPRHGARFDLQSGKALSLPATESINTYPLRIQGDYIQIGISK